MRWTEASAAALASAACRLCRGAGCEPGPAAVSVVPCACVCRRVFRVCYGRFRTCAAADSFARTVAYREVPRGVDRRIVWCRNNEDYCADFAAAGRRSLAPDLHRVFRFYYLLGGDAPLVASRLGVTRTVFFRSLLEVEAVVGGEIALMKPYSLYPPYEYMRGGTRAADVA